MSDPTDNENQPVTVIVPGPAAPMHGDGLVPSKKHSVSLRTVIIALLCLLLLILAGVIVVLPDLVAERASNEQKPAPPAPPSTVPTPPAPPVDAQRLAREKREAENTLGAVLRKQTELEAEGVSVWGGHDYETALDTLAAGDAELQAERYAQATQRYEEFAAQLDALRASMADRLMSALNEGDAALARDDGARARGSFETALAIDPQSQRAQRGMSRAKVLEEVVALIAEGAELEARGELDQAKQRFASALALDPLSARAALAHDAVVAKIRQREFQAAMSIALTALERGDFAASRAALTRADAIQPGAPEVADVSKRLQLAVQMSRISAYRKAAEDLERDERWQEASERYAAALGVDSNAAFARAGRDRSLVKARIHSELDAYISALSRLNAPGPREKARQLLGAAAGFDAASEPKLAAKVDRLGKALLLAETPVRVELQSDNLTDVTLYKVARFGRFASRDLELLPGTYVAVGKRSGYRDVRVEFTLVAGGDPAPIAIRCLEKI